MRLHELAPAVEPKRRKRLGRGMGSGHGKTCGRGTKGQKARDTVRPGFEGGQTPLYRRLPVKKGFRNPNRKEFAILNVKAIEEHFDVGEEVSPETVRAKGLIGDLKDGLKILGFGELTKKVRVRAHAFSQSAVEKIESVGGEVIRL
jgi:large subunit ribosomal protein L15